MRITEHELRRLIAEAMTAPETPAPALPSSPGLDKTDLLLAKYMKMQWKRTSLPRTRATVIIDKVRGIVFVNGKEAIDLNSPDRRPQTREEWFEKLDAALFADSSALDEKAVRGQGKNKRTLYHINRFRPARPQPKMSYLQEWDPEAIDWEGDKGDYVDVPGTDDWKRWWIKSPVKSGVFLTPNPMDIATHHGRSGNVYAYKVPEWVIEKSGGLHRYDHGSEVLIPEDVWDDAGPEIEFLGKSMDREELWRKLSTAVQVGMYGKSRPPGAAPTESPDKKFNLYGLRQTKHPSDVIKLLKPDEVKAALNAFEEEYPESLTGKKFEIEWEKVPDQRQGFPKSSQIGERPISKRDQELIDLLKKQLKEGALRTYIKELLTEMQYGGPGVEQSIGYGKNYHTVNPEPITWKNYEGLSYSISAEGDGSYYASIEVLDYPELSTPTRSFSDEGSAEWWVRDNYEKFHRFLLAQSSPK